MIWDGLGAAAEANQMIWAVLMWRYSDE